jgi:hypothetical protein
MIQPKIGLRWTLAALSVSGLIAPVVRAAEPAETSFYKAYYLETAQGDIDRAAELYGDVVRGSGVPGWIKSAAEVRLAAIREETASSDFARLMPPNSFAYVELNRPGDQLMKLLGQLGLLSDGQVPGEAGRRLAISPSLVKGLVGVRGVAVAISGFNPMKGVPSGVVVFHHGDMGVIRGLIETGLPIGAESVDAIKGWPTYHVEEQVYVTLTSRLVIASAERNQIENVIKRLNGEVTSSLADSRALSDSGLHREDALAFFMVNAKAVMPMLKTIAGVSGGSGHDLAVADALLDLDSFQSVAGVIGVADDSVSLELSLRLDDDHRSLVYNFLRTPAINRDTLKCVPAGVAAFVTGSLSEADSRFSGGESGRTVHAPVVTAMDIGREFFANITGLAVFVLPPGDEGLSGRVPMPDAGLVMSVNDPSRSEALWTQMFGLVSLVTGAGAIEGESETVAGVTARTFRFPEGVEVFVAVDGADVMIATTQSALSAAVSAKRSGNSVFDDPAFAGPMSRLTEQSTKAVFVHAGRCAEIAKQFMPPAEVREMEMFTERMTDTVLSVVLEHGASSLRFSTEIRGIPEIGDVVTKLIEAEVRVDSASRQLSEARARGDWDEALSIVDESLSATPNDSRLLRMKLDILATGLRDVEAANACARQLADVYHNNARALNNLAWALLTEDRYGGQFTDAALMMTERSNALTQHQNWMFVDTLARAKFEHGDVRDAISLEKKAIGLSDGSGQEEMKASLARFEAALPTGATAERS